MNYREVENLLDELILFNDLNRQTGKSTYLFGESDKTPIVIADNQKDAIEISKSSNNKIKLEDILVLSNLNPVRGINRLKERPLIFSDNSIIRILLVAKEVINEIQLETSKEKSILEAKVKLIESSNLVLNNNIDLLRKEKEIQENKHQLEVKFLTDKIDYQQKIIDDFIMNSKFK